MWTDRFRPGHKNIADSPFTERDEVPLSDGVFKDRDTPGSDPTFKVESKNHPDTVRRNLAMPILYFLLATYVITLGTFVVVRMASRHDLFTSNDLTAAIAAISGLQGLAAAVMGFYFGTASKESNTGD